MFRNIGKKEDFKEMTLSDKGGCLVRWDYQPIMIIDYDENGNPIGEHEDKVNASWMQENFFCKPDLCSLKKLILNYYNAIIDEEILNGFTWNSPDSSVTINIYLSSENQFNYKAAYDLAYQTAGKSLPFILKFGEIDSPQYYSFNSIEEFSDFYLKCIAFINETLQKGWVKKDSIDWSKYE